MKKLAIGVMLVVLLIAIAFPLFLAKGYPVAIVAQSSNPNSGDTYYLNGQQVGSDQGFCQTYRDGNWNIELSRNGQTQTASIYQKYGFRMTIDQPQGDDLGLQVINVNSDQSLRAQYDCDF